MAVRAVPGYILCRATDIAAVTAARLGRPRSAVLWGSLDPIDACYRSISFGIPSSSGVLRRVPVAWLMRL